MAGRRSRRGNARSVAFRATRRHHSDELAEDYAELIADLIATRGEARTCEVAAALGVSHVTALRTIRRLSTDGVLISQKHSPIHLTPKGQRIARASKDRHRLLVDFFVTLGVPADVAEIDVEGAEHHFSEATLAAVRRFLGR